GPIKLAPGGITRVTLAVERGKTFSGPVRFELSSNGSLEHAEKVTIPAARDRVEVEVKAPADAAPGRRSVALHGTADVDGFEEEVRGARIDIEIPQQETPRKK